MHQLFKKLVVLVVMLPLLLAACGGGASTSSNNQSSGNSARANIKFYVITHGQATDPFWSVVKKGVDQAAHDMGVQAIYEGPASGTFGVVAIAHLLHPPAPAHPHALLLSIPVPTPLPP